MQHLNEDQSKFLNDTKLVVGVVGTLATTAVAVAKLATSMKQGDFGKKLKALLNKKDEAKKAEKSVELEREKKVEELLKKFEEAKKGSGAQQ